MILHPRLAAIANSDAIFLIRGAINQIKAIAWWNDVMGDIPDFRMIFFNGHHGQ